MQEQSQLPHRAVCALSRFRRIHSEHAGSARKLSRKEIIHRAQELLEEHEDEHVLVSELAAGTGVSERTLRNAFNEYYDVSPLRYLQIRNAHRVHRALRKAEPDETHVTRVLLEHGETEFGRFAQRYRRLFGELPSETLRKKRPNIQSESAWQTRLAEIA